jgi:hypothetical protein
MADALPAYDGPLPPKAAASASKRGNRLGRRAAPVVPVPGAAAAGATAPPQQSVPQPSAAPLQTFIPRLNRYVQAKVSKSSGEVQRCLEPAAGLSNVSVRIKASSCISPAKRRPNLLQVGSYIEAASLLGPNGKSRETC